MKAVFIADAHLDGSKSDGYRHLLSFLDSIKGNVDELFILGDFFDFWVASNNSVYRAFSDIVEKLLEMRRGGMNVSFFEGNHDYFMSDYFEPRGIRVFSDDATITMDGKKLFLSHGDTVNTPTKSYLALRRLLKSNLIYRAQKRVPHRLLWAISRVISGTSRNYGCEAPSSNELPEEVSIFAMEKFEQGVDAVILGHFHTPLFKQTVIDGSLKTFAILGDWINNYTYLLYENGEFTMKSGGPSD